MRIIKRASKYTTLIISLVASHTALSTPSAELTWKIPSTRENGEPLPISDLKGYEIYYTSDDLTFSKTIAINNGSTSSYELKDIAAGTYYAAISAIDVNGLKSKLSSTVPFTIDSTAVPNMPTSLITTATSPTEANTSTLKVSWAPPTTRTDGTTLSVSDLSGYSINVYSMYTTAAVAQAVGGALDYTFNNIKIGQYVVGLTAIDKDGKKGQSIYQFITIQ
jgi:predicted phage tail protein